VWFPNIHFAFQAERRKKAFSILKNGLYNSARATALAYDTSENNLLAS